MASDGAPRLVGSSTVSNAGRRQQVDVVAVEPGRHGADEVILVGEVKAGVGKVGVEELNRLDAVVARLGARARPNARRLLVGRAGFTAELRRLARNRGDVELADIAGLYQGT